MGASRVQSRCRGRPGSPEARSVRMSLEATPVSVGTAEDGAFVRPASRFRGWVTDDGTTPFLMGAGRYHLYVAAPCPWSHRAILGRRLMGLEHAVGLSFVNPIRDEHGWTFGTHYPDALNGFGRLRDAYRATEPGFDDPPTVPVLWDRAFRVIVNNESGDILRMFGTVFRPLSAHPVDLCPKTLRDEIDRLNRVVHERVNDAVYRAGFARHQEIAEREAAGVFAALDELDAHLSQIRFLLGDAPVETDWRLFTTLVRFDRVYNPHFRCSARRIADYEHLWPYARDLYQWPGVASTVDFAEIYAPHALTTRAAGVESAQVAATPPDFRLPHGRAG